ncbi:hypothetical protein DFH27DRAFT_626590 [Peziza echinospora]|nr:hypothetical protein DFH27DRAFT_626590 [Peziza echinospora]
MAITASALNGSPASLTFSSDGLNIHIPASSTSSTTTTYVISSKSIIALFPTLTQNDYTLLHTSLDTPLPASFTLTNPSKELISNYLYNPSNPPQWLSPETSEISVILSTSSGVAGGSEEVYSKTVKPLFENHLNLIEGTGYTLVKTTTATTIHEYISGLSSPNTNTKAHNHTILLLSGDTSLFELINSFPTTTTSSPKITLLPLPTGTGNAFATSTYPTTHPLTSLLLGTPTPLPLISVTFPPTTSLKSTSLPTPPSNTLYASVVLSWAFHAALVADSDTQFYRTTYPDTTRFFIAAQANLLPTPHLYKGKISTLNNDGSSWTEIKTPSTPGTPDGYWYFLATLISNLESTFPISPLTTPSTGKGAEEGPLMDVMNAVYDNGRHITLPAVGYERDGVDGLRIELLEEDYIPETEDSPHDRNRWRRICIDGAILEVEKGGWVEVRRVEKGLEGLSILWRGGVEV